MGYGEVKRRLKEEILELYHVILGANYLAIKSLVDKGCKAVATLIQGKTPDEIKQTFNATLRCDHAEDFLDVSFMERACLIVHVSSDRLRDDLIFISLQFGSARHFGVVNCVTEHQAEIPFIRLRAVE